MWYWFNSPCSEKWTNLRENLGSVSFGSFSHNKSPLTVHPLFFNMAPLLRIESTSFTFPGPTVPWASVRGAAGLGRLALRWGSGSPKPQTPAPGQPLVGTDQPGNWVTPRPGRPLSKRLISKWFEVKLSLSFFYISVEGFRGFRNVVGCMEHFCTSLMGDGSADKTPAHKQKRFKKANAHKRKGWKKLGETWIQTSKRSVGAPCPRLPVLR